MKKNIFLFIIWALLFGLSGTVLGNNPAVYFDMPDPLGDEFGPGNYQYPSNVAFQPYQGIFDIINFKVWSGRPGFLYFDTEFAKITNPWIAPEGFIHQNLRIFIDCRPKQGLDRLPRAGAYVRFDPRYAWDVALRIAGWGNSQLIKATNGELAAQPLMVEKVAGNTIRATVPLKELGVPDPSWRYYVFVGSYDGFGEDLFRKVRQQSGEWVIGGGSDQAGAPRIMDLLAPAHGPHRQQKQLAGYNLQTGALAMIYPVGKQMTSFHVFVWLAGFLLFLLVAAGCYFVYQFIRKHGKIHWFWVTPKNKE